MGEYYPTRTELEIMERNVEAIASQIGRGVMLVEYGSGSSVKTRTLLDALDAPVAYVPVDISEEHLRLTAESLHQSYPNTEVVPVVADFTQRFALPKPNKPFSHVALYFPGSTIGNFTPAEAVDEYGELVEIGMQHEQQHQELILTDIKHVLSCNPTWPIYEELPFDSVRQFDSEKPIDIDEGVYETGHAGNSFAFDNESPRHKVFLHSCQIDRQLVTCGEYLEFMNDRGCLRPECWLSLGWAAVNQNEWSSPLYWHETPYRTADFCEIQPTPTDQLIHVA